VELEHTASLSGAITALRQDEKQRITEVADKVKQDEEVCCAGLGFHTRVIYGYLDGCIGEESCRASKANGGFGSTKARSSFEGKRSCRIYCQGARIKE